MLTSLLLAIAMTGTPEIHRCPAADGSLVYQDRPCATAAASRRPSPRSSPPRVLSGPVDEQRLAACSERFLHCSSDDGARMDRCIATIARCGVGSGSVCCPSACIDRYRDLRRDGASRSSAVRLALLDPDSPSCTAVAP